MGYGSGNRTSVPLSNWGGGACGGIETPNRFRSLQTVGDDDEILSQGSYGKRKASSPLQEQTSVKKPINELLSDAQEMVNFIAK